MIESKRFSRPIAALALLLSLSAAPASSQGPEENEVKDEQPAAAAEYNVNKVVERMVEIMRADTNYAEMKMTIYNPAWPSPREIEFKSWDHRENDDTFIRITAPPRERGKAFLKKGNVFKVYIPTRRENKPITIPPSLMLQSWMGSDFTYDDLAKQSSMIEDYDKFLEGVEKREGPSLLRIRLEPREDAAVVWGKVMVWARARDYIPVRYLYYDDRGEKARDMTLSNIEKVDSRKVPLRWEMRNLEPGKEGHRTALVIQEIEFNVEIGPSVFTEKNLTRRDWE